MGMELALNSADFMLPPPAMRALTDSEIEAVVWANAGDATAGGAVAGALAGAAGGAQIGQWLGVTGPWGYVAGVVGGAVIGGAIGFGAYEVGNYFGGGS